MKQTSNFSGIRFLGWIFIWSSLGNMMTLLTEAHWYINDVYGHWPQWAANLRYSFSWFQRCLGLAAGIGILLQKDIFRKLALVIACFTISTIYWKHPYDAYYLHTQKMVAKVNPYLFDYGIAPVSFKTFVMPALILNCLLDIGFSLCVIYYFTRPKVIQQFKKQMKYGI